jgi:lycopene beta-cyclase
LNRILEQPYAAISSERFHQVVAESLIKADGCLLATGASAEEITAGRVTLADGRVLEGWVVDARGPAAETDLAGAGFQKFVGLELELNTPAQISLPTVMDARVTQHDGYRFVYVLPFSERRVLVEDTYFADGPVLDRDLLRERVHAYAREQGWDVAGVVREEAGVLPMPWTGPIPAPIATPFVAGYRGGWFHPGTGYSLPVAVRVAQLIADSAPEPPTRAALEALHAHFRRQAWFTRALNWALFRGAVPDQRWRILERFYRLPEETILRFYALELDWRRDARIVVGKPPGGLRIPWPRRRSGAR